MRVRERAAAKINLTLSVLSKRADGYHNLLSLVGFAALADEVEIEFGQKTQLMLDGPFAAQTPADESNSALQALKFLGLEAKIKITKNIPLGAGLGGGSADGAAVLRAASRVMKTPLPANIFSLGADVPACYLSQSLWLMGAGERVEGIFLPKLWCVLTSELQPSSTKEIFSAWDAHNPRSTKGFAPPPPPPPPDLLTADRLFAFCRTHGNDLTAFVPQAQRALEALGKSVPTQAFGMSGSGSACFGLYESESAAKSVANALKEKGKFWVWSGALLL